MGNVPTKGASKKTKKYVHWSHAEKATPPGKPHLVPGTPRNQPDVVTIRWELPASDGGAPVTGYLVEHRRTGSPHWVRATPALVPVSSLTLSGLEPGWRYQFRVSAENAAGMSEPGELSEPLTVTMQRVSASAPYFQLELKDTIALENDKASFLVEFRGTPTPAIAWFKDGFEVFSSRRTKITTEHEQSSLVIFQAAFSDEGEIKCTATNRVGHVVTRAKLRLEAPPRIRLPRQYEDGLLFEMDEVIRLKVNVVGRPLPRVTWFHNGDQVLFGGRHEVANTERFSSLRVDAARREDRGEYQVKATNRLGEDLVSFLVTVTDRPVPPGQVKVTMTLGRSVTLSWTQPDDDGGCKIGNYIVEYYRLGWNVWLKAATCRQLTTTLGDLIEGSEYKFRVKAENPYGVSDPSGESGVVFIADPKRGILEAPAKDSTLPMNQPEIPEQLKEDRKRRHPPISDSNIPKKEKHLDSSMEYPSSDPDSCSDLVTPENRRRRDQKQSIPLTVVEYDRDRVEIARVSSSLPAPADGKKARNKDNFTAKTDYKSKALENWISKQDSMSEPKTKSTNIKRSTRPPPRDDVADVEMVAKVFSLKIPVGRSARSEERDEEVVKPRVMERGSSEMLLVLVPHDRGAQSETEREIHADFCRSFVAAGDLGVAPPMSLSSPELGCGEPVVLPALRNAVSSMELLHERAMDRLYQEAEAEEAASARMRSRSYERLASDPMARNRARMNASEQEKAPQTSPRVDNVSKPTLASAGRDRNKPQLTDEEEEEEAEFQRLKERIAQALKDDSKEVEREMRYKRDDKSTEEDDEELEEEEEELEEELDEEEIEEEEEEEDDEEEYDDENPEEEDDSGDELARTPATARRPYSDDEDEPYHPRGAIVAPPPVPMHREILTLVTLDDKTREVTPMRHEPKSDLQPKPILKTSSKFGKDESPKKAKPPSPRASTPFDETKTKKPLINTFLNKIESPFKRAKTPPAASSVVVRRPKKESPPKSAGKDPGQEAERQEGDLGLSAAEMARKRRFQTRQSSLEEDAEANKILISHYSDIVKEYGVPKKTSPTLFMNTEELKAAAEGNYDFLDKSLSTSPEPIRDNARKYPQESNEGSRNLSSPIPGRYGEAKQQASRPAPTKPVAQPYVPKPIEQTQPPKPAPTKPVAQPYAPKPIEPKRQETQPSKPAPTKALRQEAQQYIAAQKQSRQDARAEMRRRLSDDEDDDDDDVALEAWQFTPQHMMARIRRSLTPRRSLRRPRLDSAVVKRNAETRVHHFIAYLTDLAMFLVACWLYLFKDERLAIPVILMMVYRQMHEAVINWIPKRWRRK